MDLDNIKKVWKEQKNASFSREEILTMLQKKSSSAAKWIFYISVAEFAFWVVLSIIFPEDTYILDADSLRFSHIITYIHYIIVIAFMILFFRNYLKIKASETVRELLKNIFNVRKTVHYYIIYNILMFAFGFFIGIKIGISNSEKLHTIPEHVKNSTVFWVTIIIFCMLFFIVFLTVLYFFYKLLYGFLLRRLKKNYNEVKDLE